MHDMYKGNSNQVVCCLGSKVCSGTPLCLMMHTRATYRYDESCVKTFCKLHTCNTSSLTVIYTQRVSNLILASNPPRMAMVSIYHTTQTNRWTARNQPRTCTKNCKTQPLLSAFNLFSVAWYQGLVHR